MRLFNLIVIISLLMFGLTLPAAALTLEGRNTLFSDSDRTVNDVYAGGGGTVDLSGTFNNDLLAAGGTVTIPGKVAGDILVAGGTVKITGNVSGSVRAAGGTIEIDGAVGRNVLVAGGSIILGRNSKVAGEVTVTGGTLTFQGTAGKDFNFWGGSAVINGSIDGSVNLRTGDDCGQDPCITLGPNARIKGNLTYWAAMPADIHASAIIDGSTTRHAVSLPVKTKDIERFFTGLRFWAVFSSLVVGVVLALFLPKVVRQVAEQMTRRPGPAIGFGLLVLFAGPMAFVFLAITLVGIPLALILFGLYLLGLYVAQIFLGYFFGTVIVRALRRSGAPNIDLRRGSVFWATMVGMVALALIFDFLLGASLTGGLPYIGFFGGLLRFALVVWAFGGLILHKWQYVKEHGA
ncbi:MAG: hypothetical protein HYY50_03460 [Candidatus Kerfeldbacteria bacterium]|nr:hypothetical protein [Candidatus Kerfeldbacteria bacterium]